MGGEGGQKQEENEERGSRNGRGDALAAGLITSAEALCCVRCQLVLVVGDLHVPHRAEDIPEQFKTLLQSRVQQVICTGNLCMKSTEEFIRSMAYNAHIVRGDLDAGLDLPESKVIKIGEISIGIIHGHQIVPWSDTALLANHARAMGVDVLVHGHSHTAMVARAEGSATAKDVPSSPSAAASSAAAAAGSTLLLNPGSLTGAYSPFTSSVVPSFLLLAIQGASVLIYTYELGADGNVSVSKSDWRKAK